MADTRKEYYLKNRERIIAKALEAYYSNKEEKKAYQRQYTEDNRQRLLGYAKEYYKKRKAADPSYRKHTPLTPKPRRAAKPRPTKKPKLQPEPRKPKYEFKDASFIVSLD
jgi:hypothetical protein